MNQEDKEILEVMLEGIEATREKFTKLFDDIDDDLEFIKKHLGELPKPREERYAKNNEYFNYLRNRSTTERTPESEGPEQSDC